MRQRPQSSLRCAQEGPYDLLIRGGRIVDGTGNPAFTADVGIRGDRIAAIGRLADARATREIDARTLVVAPGFIDLHTHSDLPLINDGNAESKVRQGVTIDVIGESTSVAPRDGLPEAKDTWTDFTGYWSALARKGISMNVISEVSYNQVRLVVMGYSAGPANAAELERMKELTLRSMREGAWGLVTRFESGGPAHPQEVIELAKVVASRGGIYVSHIGSEGMQQDKELDFAIRVAEEAKLPVHIFHFKIRGQKNWGTIGKHIAKIEAARGRGLDITANQYPYTAMQHQWSAFFPVWAREEGPQQFAAMLKDPATRLKIKQERIFRRGSTNTVPGKASCSAGHVSRRTGNTRACASPRSPNFAAMPIRPTRAWRSWRKRAAPSPACSTRCRSRTSAR